MAVLEYVWLDGYDVQNLRSKIKVTTDGRKLIKSPSDCPEWSFDGSSTRQATGDSSDCILKPVRLYKNPMLSSLLAKEEPIWEPCWIVLCEVTDTDGNPHESNKRRKLAEIVEKYKDHEVWFGFEQEYTLFNRQKTTPYLWPTSGQPEPQGRYYCGVGADVAWGREISLEHLKLCMQCGIHISGTNAEVMPSQWEFQIGPVNPLEGADHLWIARFLLERIAEQYGTAIKLHPKPLDGDWNGAGCHVNFSTRSMREHCPPDMVNGIINAFGNRTSEHIEVYGYLNERRLTGEHETCHIDDFRAGANDRGASIRIPPTIAKDHKGYLEDRRPAANMNPYEVGSRIVETVCKACEEMKTGVR